MPERKGRRRRNRDRHDRDPIADAGPRAAASPSQSVQSEKSVDRSSTAGMAMPSNNARATGFIIAVITAFLSVLMIRDAIGGDHSTAEAAIRIVGATLLILLAIVVAVLVLIPAQLRRFFVARRGG